MKTTILLKKTDLVIQAIFCGFTLEGLIIDGRLNDFVLVLGLWQLFSAMLHLFFQEKLYASVHRNNYGLFLLGTIAAFFLSFLFWLSVVLYAVIVCVLLLLLYYLYICFDELAILDRKAVVHLRK